MNIYDEGFVFLRFYDKYYKFMICYKKLTRLDLH